ncbi:DUF6193 family natural product biosynthesis protein [Streptomyces sp. 2131.1]|uniref:DUF6193 family natural product biosynthesis protein n=1 Tax=Streptomyces sp. 2131.1 TaxID=1855346 RepID=UPI00115F8E96
MEPTRFGGHRLVSHWTLGFSSRAGYPFRDEVAIVASHSGSPFRVKRHPLSDDVLGEAATAEEAVALAVRHVPTDLGRPSREPPNKMDDERESSD